MKKKMSAEARKKISRAQKKRWRVLKNGHTSKAETLVRAKVSVSTKTAPALVRYMQYQHAVKTAITANELPKLVAEIREQVLDNLWSINK